MIELYKKYMVDLGKDNVYGKAESADQEHRTLEGEAHTRREEKALPKEHSATGKRVHGIRRRTRKHADADKISEDLERYPSTTRFIESSLGIKSYSELAPYLAQGVVRVMAHLLNQKTDDLKVTPEFICSLHKDAFGELFPSWSGMYRDRIDIIA